MVDEQPKKRALKRIFEFFCAALDRPALQAVWLAIAALAAYSNTIFAGVSPEETKITDGSFRPLAAFSYYLMGDAAFVNHFFNLILYVGACIAAWWVLRLLFRGGLIPFFAGLIFAVHPVHADAVASVSGRSDLMSGLFVLIAWALYILGRSRQTASGGKLPLYHTITGCAMFLLALLSSPNAWTFLLLAAGAEILKSLPAGKFDFKSVYKLLLPYLAVLAAFMVTRLLVTGDIEGAPSPASDNPLTQSGLLTRFATSLIFAGQALIVLIAPIRLSLAGGYAQTSPVSIVSPAGLTAVLLSAVALFALYFAARKWKISGFAGLFFFAAYIPVSNIIYTVQYAFAERYLFLAALFPAIVFGGTLDFLRTEKTRTSVIVALIVLLLFFAALSFTRNFSYF